MSLRLSLVIVLLALVGLHSSEKVDRPPNPDASTDASKPLVDPLAYYVLLPPQSYKHYKHIKHFISAHKDTSSCRMGGEDAMGVPIIDPQLDELTFNAIMNRRELCFSRLEEEMQSELDAMSESTREHFKLFAELDQRECSSAPGSLCFIFGNLNLVIGKLRRLIGSPKEAELEVAKGFVSACKEMAGHAPLAIIRAKYEQATPSSAEPYYPHVRFYDFCRQLSNCLLDLKNCPYFNTPSYKVEAIVKILDEGKTMSSEAAKSGHEQEQLFFEAVVGYAKSRSEHVSLFNKRKWLTKELNDLREKCLPVLSSNENFTWLHQLDPQGVISSGWPRRQIEEYLRCLGACKQLGKIEDEQIIKAVMERQKLNKMIKSIKTSLSSSA
jgi:hypothetical protein